MLSKRPRRVALALSFALTCARACALTLATASSVAAADEPLRRVLVCAGPSASEELYLPESIVTGSGIDHVDLSKPVIGAYTLDLSAAGKGKVLEWVRVSLADDGKAVIVDQFTRGLEPTRVPVEGGVVDFDKRFATEAMCPEFNVEPEFD